MRDWRIFWEAQTRPLHRFDDEEHYRTYAQELVMLFDSRGPQSVLELGCGNGALFRHLGFAVCGRYRGVDFSTSMLQVFEADYPGVDVVQADADSYMDDKKYDLIFSSEFVQYLTMKGFDRSIANAKRMLEPTGRIVCASVPWKALRRRYFSGECAANPSGGDIRKTLRLMAGRLTSKIGTWYELADFIDTAQRHDLNVAFHGSFHYPYRFHAVLTARSDHNQVHR